MPLVHPSASPAFAGGLLRGLAAVAVAAALAACGSPAPKPPPTPVASAQTPKVGPKLVDGKPQIALLAPLTGRASDVGRSLQEAAELALFEVAGKDVALVPIDTGDTPEGAMRAFDRAAAQGVSMVIGPLFGASTAAIAGPAQRAAIPVVSFSNDENVAQPGVYVMGVAVGPQVRRVAEYAVQKGFRRFAAFSPQTAFGDSASRALEDAAVPLGASVVASQSFNPNAVDPAAQARALAQQSRAEQKIAVFLPVGQPRVGSVALALREAGFEKPRTQLVGTGIWDSRDLWRETALDGAWYAAPDPARRADFERRYAAAYGKPPHRLATLAYDAVALSAILARQRPGGGDFSAAAIGNPNGYAGNDGLFRFRPDGKVERGLAVLEISEGRVSVVSPAPAAFDSRTN